jgi:hypothetical protein
VSLEPGDRGAGGQGSEQEPRQREQRCRNGESRGAGERKADEHDLAGHVRDEDPAEAQDADRVDDACDRGHQQKHHRKPAVLRVGQKPAPPGTGFVPDRRTTPLLVVFLDDGART